MAKGIGGAIQGISSVIKGFISITGLTYILFSEDSEKLFNTLFERPDLDREFKRDKKERNLVIENKPSLYEPSIYKDKVYFFSVERTKYTAIDDEDKILREKFKIHVDPTPWDDHFLEEKVRSDTITKRAIPDNFVKYFD